jgi:hypothetical protein
MKSSRLNDDPNRPIPYTEMLEPKRPSCRNENELPKDKKSKIDMELPIRVMP